MTGFVYNPMYFVLHISKMLSYKRLKTLGRPSNARRYKVNPGWHARGGIGTRQL